MPWSSFCSPTHGNNYRNLISLNLVIAMNRFGVKIWNEAKTLFINILLGFVCFQADAQIEPQNSKDSLKHHKKKDNVILKTYDTPNNISTKVKDGQIVKDSLSIGQIKDSLNVETQMLSHLKALLNGKVDAFLSYYVSDYEDIRIKKDTKSDKEVLRDMMVEVQENQFFKNSQLVELSACIQADKTKFIDFKDALAMGLPTQIDDFKMQEGDIGVAVLWNGSCFFQGNMVRIFRKLDNEWKIVAGF